MKENDWKDLDIKDIPSDFFVNEGYEVECYIGGKDPFYTLALFKTSERGLLIVEAVKGVKYRYRLKPLESIRITQKGLNVMIQSEEFDYSVGTDQERWCNKGLENVLDLMSIKNNYVLLDGRRVEII